MFTAPRGGGNLIQLVLFLSSFARRAEPVRVTVSRVVGNQWVVFYTHAVTLPAGEVQRLTVDDVEGQTLEVAVEAVEDILPSAGVTQTFRADGATVVLAWKAAGDFVRL